MSSNKLLAPENYWIQDSADSYLEWVKGYNESGLPRFDQCSIVASRVRILVYDNPLLAMRLGGTACVIAGTPDIYMYSEFAKQLIEKDISTADTTNPTTDVAFILLHELSHKVLEHIDSVTHWQDEFGVSLQNSNYGMDTIINIGLNQYPDINVSFKKNCEFDTNRFKVTKGFYGLTEYERSLFGYGRASALEVSRHYQQLEDEDKANAEQEQKQDSGPGEPGDGADGKESDKDQTEGQSANDKNGEDSNGDKPGGEFGVDHSSELKDLVDALNECGLGDLIKRLGYPTDEESREKAIEAESANIKADLNAYQKIKKQLGGQGSHIDDFLTKAVKAKENIAMHCDLDEVFTDSLGLGKDDMMFFEDEPSEQFMHDPSLYGASERVWEGTHIPVTSDDAILAIFDTSGSMDAERVGFCLGAIKGSLSSIPGVDDVIVVEADTVARKVWLTTVDELENTDEFDFNGYGGTDIAPVMIEGIMRGRELIEGQIKAVIYLTDMECIIPGREEMEELFRNSGINNIPPTAFLVPPQCGNQELFDQVKDWASVTEIAHGNSMNFKPSEETKTTMRI